MSVKIVDQTFKTTLAKSFYNYVRNTDLDDTFYASVAQIPDAEYNSYIGTKNALDSDYEFFGGTNDIRFDETDRSFYSQNTVSLHKIFPGGISRVVKRQNWDPNTVYTAWPSESCNVLVKEYVAGYARLNVYRCLFSPNKPSTYSPSGISSSEFYLPDGYVWKYLYTISNSEAQRFLNNDWMPVPEKITSEEAKTITTTTVRYNQYVVQENAVVGDLYGVNVDSDVMAPLVIAAVSLDVVALPTTSTTSTQKLEVNLTYDTNEQKIVLSLTQKGEGYDGPVRFYDKATESIEYPGLSGNLLGGLGHGSDVASEMFASNILIVSRNIPSDNALKVINDNEFNAVSLIKNPIDSTTRGIAKKDFYVACKSLDLDQPGLFLTGDFLQPDPNDDGRRGQVISVHEDKVYYISYRQGFESDTFLDSENITDSTNAKISTVRKSIDREILFDSGELLMFDKKATPVVRSIDQIEVLSFVLSF